MINTKFQFLGLLLVFTLVLTGCNKNPETSVAVVEAPSAPTPVVTAPLPLKHEVEVPAEPQAEALVDQDSNSSEISKTNEVGNKMFVFEPKADPIFVSQSGTKYWHCEGMVAPKLIEFIHAELSLFSKQENIPLPMMAPCYYTIGLLTMFENTIEIHSVEFFVSEKSMTTCLQRNFCDNFRTMTFKFIDDKFYRQYLLTNADKKLTRFACIENTGKVNKLREGCT